MGSLPSSLKDCHAFAVRLLSLLLCLQQMFLSV